MSKILIDDYYYNQNKDELMVTLYFNSIGSKPDKVLKTALSYAGFRSPKVKMATYGPYKVHKYSYLCNVEDMNHRMDMLHHYIHTYAKDITILKQNKNNVYCIEKINFYE